MKKELNVACVVRSTFDTIKGGDSIQLMSTAQKLQELGVGVVIKKASEPINYSEFDLLHFFNLIRPSDHLRHARKSSIPYVVSTIYLDYSLFDLHARSSIQKRIFKTLGQNGSEYLKNMYRFAKGQDTLVSREYLLGHAKAFRYIAENARLLLPNSTSEYDRLSKSYGIQNQYHVVPNGVDKELFSTLPQVIRNKRQVLSVGQIYGLKNQHNLILACKELDVDLVLIGKPPPNHQSYVNYCKKIAGSRVQFVDFMPQKQLLQYYASSKVHALPSWFETTGLSSLEAGAMGCNIVVGSGGDTSDYFSGYATFCVADDVNSITQALETELNKENTSRFREHILQNYTWENAAHETFKAYKMVLNGEV